MSLLVFTINPTIFDIVPSSFQDIADNVYTDRGVISEIRDSATRKRLAVLPYELKCREPSSEARHIGRFQVKVDIFEEKHNKYIYRRDMSNLLELLKSLSRYSTGIFTILTF